MRVFIDVIAYDELEDEHVEKSVVVNCDEETLKMIEDELEGCLTYVGEVITEDGEDYMTTEIVRINEIEE